MYTHNGRTIQANRAWTSDDGYQHPSTWTKCWGEADLKRWSVIWTDDPVVKSFDNRFYWDADTPRSLTDIEGTDSNGDATIAFGLKSVWIAKKKAEANDLLSKTDWYITRKQEKDTAIPSAITTERDGIRTACAGIETKINACDTLDKFIALFSTSEDGDGNVVKSDMDCY